MINPTFEIYVGRRVYKMLPREVDALNKRTLVKGESVNYKIGVAFNEALSEVIEGIKQFERYDWYTDFKKMIEDEFNRLFMQLKVNHKGPYAIILVISESEYVPENN